MLLNGLIDPTRARTALNRLHALPVTVSRSQPLISEACTVRQNLIVQDAVYVVLARHIGAPLLTGDRRIAGSPGLPVQVLHVSTTG